VLGMDTARGSALMVTDRTQPASGTMVLNADAMETCAPTTKAGGSDSSTDQASHAQSQSKVATVTMQVKESAPTRDSDLQLVNRGPGQTVIDRFSKVGGARQNFVNLVLDDEGTLQIMRGFAPFTSTYGPVANLSLLEDKNVTGTWTLDARDTVGSFPTRFHHRESIL
jgi:hypothetical protein